MNSKPAGKPIVWLALLAVAAIVLALLATRGGGHRNVGAADQVGVGQTQGEIESSAVPGTQNEASAPVTNPNATAAPQGSR